MQRITPPLRRPFTIEDVHAWAREYFENDIKYLLHPETLIYEEFMPRASSPHGRQLFLGTYSIHGENVDAGAMIHYQPPVELGASELVSYRRKTMYGDDPIADVAQIEMIKPFSDLQEEPNELRALPKG